MTYAFEETRTTERRGSQDEKDLGLWYVLRGRCCERESEVVSSERCLYNS